MTGWKQQSGNFDVPLVFHDRVFDPSGKGYFDLFNLDGIIGDKYTVNGKIQPFMRVARRKYRFRAQNIGTSRFYNFFLSNGMRMTRSTHDGNSLPVQLGTKILKFIVDGKQFDAHVITASLRQGTAEIWNIVNNSGGWMHPVHIQFEEHQIISRNGKTPPADEIAREDLVWLGHGETVKTFRQFRDFLDRFPTHCHNVVHEDHAMIFMWKIVP